jgi:inhibitor of cysteine peptidase
VYTSLIRSVLEVHTEVKRKTAAYGVAAVLLALLLSVVCYNFVVVKEPTSPGQPDTGQTFLQRFSSYEELVSFLDASLKAPSPYAYYNSPWRLAWEGGKIMPAHVETFSYMATDVPEYSKTNIQVEGVDEADIVKTDGTYLYVASNNSLFILKAYPPEEAEVLSRIGFNGTLGEIFLNGNKLAILGSSVIYPYISSYSKPPTIIDDKTVVEVYDISNRSNPVLARNFSISGNYFDSRRIDEYVYLIVSQPAYLIYDTLVLPKIYSTDGIEEIEASQIYYANISDYSYAFTTVVAINIHNDTEKPTYEPFLLGATSCMYVSLNNIYMTFWTQGGGTLIYRVRIEDETIECEASGEVPGSVLNQFSMDEYNDYFRIATTAWINGTSQNNVYVLDMNLTVVGELENIAPTETIYSVRFMGERGYVVTFRQVDPFFAIDLQDPYSPQVLGVLKIPGYSSYLHPYDESHIIGIGKDGSVVKISLFDVSNVTDPKEIGNYTVSGKWSDSPVLRDHKALLFNSSKNLLVMPIITSDYSVWQGAYVFNITIQEGIVLRGQITHIENASDLGYYYYYPHPYHVKRTLYIDNVLYTISDKKVMMHNLETLDEINQIELS